VTRGVAGEMAAAAAAFLEALDPSGRARASLPFETEDRLAWAYWPADRRGLALKAMDTAQRERAMSLLDSVLSEPGAKTARAIIAHEDILGALEREAGGEMFPRDAELYYVTLFGEPGGPAWGWRFEGHHVSVRATVAGGGVAITPSFFGANPAEVPSGPRKGRRILAPLEDRGRALVASLDARQRARALISPDAPFDIVTSPLSQTELGSPAGLPGSEMTGAQRAGLIGLVREHVGRAREPLAEGPLARLDADAVRFAWAGGLGRGEPHYYRIHDGAFLIEYANVQDSANHIHAVWRDLEDDFGADLLRKHQTQHHQSG
jgi:hypothetical protein